MRVLVRENVADAVLLVDPIDLVAFPDIVIAADLAENGRSGKYDKTECDCRAHVEHAAQHPRAILVNLQSLDVPDGHDSRDCSHDNQSCDDGLLRYVATRWPPQDNADADMGDYDQAQDEIAVDAMKEHEFVADDRGEL